jgi:hypothetical protein
MREVLLGTPESSSEAPLISLSPHALRWKGRWTQLADTRDHPAAPNSREDRTANDQKKLKDEQGQGIRMLSMTRSRFPTAKVTVLKSAF